MYGVPGPAVGTRQCRVRMIGLYYVMKVMKATVNKAVLSEMSQTLILLGRHRVNHLRLPPVSHGFCFDNLVLMDLRAVWMIWNFASNTFVKMVQRTLTNTHVQNIESLIKKKK